VSMATILTPAPAAPPALSSDLGVSLVGALAALVIGVAALLGAAVLPAVPSHPIMGPAQAASRTTAEQDDAGHDVAGMPQSPGHLFPRVDRLAADHRAPASTTAHRTGVDPETALARGTRAESAQLATTVLHPAGRDVRGDLREMAAAQRRDWRVRCPCPV
jgi:hypothetical protein